MSTSNQFSAECVVRMRCFVLGCWWLSILSGCQQDGGPPLVKAPGQIRTATSDTEDAIKRLIERLKSENDDKAHYTAIELAKFKKQAVPLLVAGLESPRNGTRKWCARALTNIVGGYGDDSGRPDVVSAGPALIAAVARERDASVAWYMVQAVGVIQPEAREAMPVLLRLLPKADVKLQRAIVEAVGEYKAQAMSAKPTLISLVRACDDDELRGETVTALNEIGITEADARELGGIKFPGASRAAASLLLDILRYPDPALAFLETHPDLLQHEFISLASDQVIRVMNATSAKTSALRSHLRQRDDLPGEVMVGLGSPEFLARVQARIETASRHERTFWLACARALGRKADRVVEISEDHPGNFSPKSAHPGSDPDRWADGGGHGDGFQRVLITGRLLMRDGSAAIEPRFYHTNDRMLLGEQRKDPAKLTRYDPRTGRFVFFTSVFAAHALGEGQKEPGPYQTGAAQTLIEAKGAKPLTVNFYDEMPDVKITLSAAVDDDAPTDFKAVAPPRKKPLNRDGNVPRPGI